MSESDSSDGVFAPKERKPTREKKPHFTSYTMYMLEERKKGIPVTATNSVAWNRSIAEQWKSVSREEKQKWRQLALEAKQRLATTKPGSSKKRSAPRLTAMSTKYVGDKKRRVEVLSEGIRNETERLHALSQRTGCEVLLLVRSEDGNERCFCTDYYNDYQMLLGQRQAPQSVDSWLHGVGGGQSLQARVRRLEEQLSMTKRRRLNSESHQAEAPLDSDKSSVVELAVRGSNIGTEHLHVDNGTNDSSTVAGIYKVSTMSAFPDSNGSHNIAKSTQHNARSIAAPVSNPFAAEAQNKNGHGITSRTNSVAIADCGDLTFEITENGSAEIISKAKDLSDGDAHRIDRLKSALLIDDELASLLRGNRSTVIETSPGLSIRKGSTLHLLDSSKSTPSILSCACLDANSCIPSITAVKAAQQAVIAAVGSLNSVTRLLQSDDETVYSSQQLWVLFQMHQLYKDIQSIPKEQDWIQSTAQRLPKLIGPESEMSRFFLSSNSISVADVSTLMLNGRWNQEIASGSHVYVRDACSLTIDNSLTDDAVAYFAKAFTSSIDGYMTVGPLLYAKLILHAQDVDGVNAVIQRCLFVQSLLDDCNHVVGVIHRPERKHWIYTRVDLTSPIHPQLYIYDSGYRKPEKDLLVNLKNIAIAFHQQRYKRPLSHLKALEHDMVTFVSEPQQSKGTNDCGMYCLGYLFHDIRNISFGRFTQHQARAYRYLMLRHLVWSLNPEFLANPITDNEDGTSY